MTTVEVFAPAKINLTLHVTGQREDGYHLLDSLVVFADVGDKVTLSNFTEAASAEAKGTFALAGLESGNLPSNSDNLVGKALDFMIPERIAPFVRLVKNLPVSSGIGGGSTDAAATIRAVSHGLGMKNEDLLDQTFLDRLSRELGADVPMCLEPRPWRATGIGEQLAPFALPTLYAVLANPRVPVSTPEVFKHLANRDNTPMAWPPATNSLREFCDWLTTQRNDLEPIARTLVPEVGEVLFRLKKIPGALLARMSGSGATCFAIFETEDEAKEAEQGIKRFEPNWWVRAATLGDMSKAAQPIETVN